MAPAALALVVVLLPEAAVAAELVILGVQAVFVGAVAAAATTAATTGAAFGDGCARTGTGTGTVVAVAPHTYACS